MNQKRVISLVLALVMSLCLLSACTPAAPTTTGAPVVAGKVKYQVTLIDPYGEPFTNGVVVKFMDKDGKQVAMQTPNANGVAAKELESGDYTVELSFSDANASYSYDIGAMSLSATKTELKVDLYHEPTQSMILYHNNKENVSYFVGPGMTKVKLTPGERTYFIFTTRQTGFYEFSVTGDITCLDMYGGTHYVTDYGTGEKVEGKENVLELNLHHGYVSEDGAQQFVLGIDGAEGVTEVILNVMRQGDYIITPDIAPWTIYQTTAALKPFTLPEGVQIQEFYMSASYTIVYNEEDGYYHKDTKDGPLVLLRLGKNAADACRFALGPFETLFGTSEILGKYVYDENGEFVEKIGYVECLKEYVEMVDEKSGLYPVTKDLKHIIDTLGENKGWWDAERYGASYLFWDEAGNMIEVNPETAWLFNCCYFE